MTDKSNEYEVSTGAELQRKYGLYAERRAVVRINPNDVPEDLRDLITLAEFFGVICDITRHDLGQKTTQKEKDDLTEALRGRHDRINEWLNSYFPEDGSMPVETNPATAYFGAMCTFELEENNGPGLGGNPEWYAKAKLRWKSEDLERRRSVRSGPPCKNCGEPLRTAQARRCFDCGTNVT